MIADPDAKDEQQGRREHAVVPLLAAGARGNRKHATHHRPGQDVDHPSNQGHRGVQAGLSRRKEMLHQHDVEIVDDYGAHKESNGLQSFPEGHRDWFRMINNFGPRRRNGQ